MRDHRLFTFLIKAMTKQLATADKLHPALRRTGIILMCPLCSGPEAHTHTHPFICPSSRTAYLTARAKTTHNLRELCRWIADTGAVSLAHCTQLAVYSTTNFFDMQSAGCLLFPTHDVYAGAIGVVPPDLQTALAPEPELTGPEPAVKFMRAHLSEHMRTFQLETLRGAMAVYNAWVKLAK